MVRRLDRQGEVLKWCRKCSGHARQRVGPKLMNHCKPEKAGIKECGKMLKRNQVLEEDRILVNEARDCTIEGQKRRTTRKEYRRVWNEFETGGFMAQKAPWNVARENILEDRGALPKEDGHPLRECKAMHEEDFLSSWLREDVEGGKTETQGWMKRSRRR